MHEAEELNALLDRQEKLAKDRMAGHAHALERRASKPLGFVRGAVRRHPKRALAGAAGVGAVLGLRRGSKSGSGSRSNGSSPLSMVSRFMWMTSLIRQFQGMFAQGVGSSPSTPDQVESL